MNVNTNNFKPVRALLPEYTTMPVNENLGKQSSKAEKKGQSKDSFILVLNTCFPFGCCLSLVVAAI